VSEFGADWYKANVEAEFKNRVRQAVRKHGMNETAINATAIDEIDEEVSKALVAYVTKARLPIELIDVTVGRANPPDSIKSQRVETAAQEQRVNTEKQRALAENSRLAAERARADADNAYREAMKLSPDQFLQLETIKMQQVACAKGGCTFLIGGGAVPVFNTK
jgi:regulator of protease activity HflC (stomatin/prohibitin superfamily)